MHRRNKQIGRAACEDDGVKMNEKEQAKYCLAMMDRIADNVDLWIDSGRPSWAGWKTEKFSGASKTQIANDITHLRRELLVLERMIER